MKKITYSLLFSLFVFAANAQVDSIFRQKNPQKSYYLKAINRINGNYYYGNRKINGLAAFDVPFYELNDSTVNYHFEKNKRLRKIGGYIMLVPLVSYLVVASTTRYSIGATNILIGTYFGSVVASIGFAIAANNQVTKATLRYNQALKENRIGYWTVEPDDKSLGLAVRYRF